MATVTITGNTIRGATASKDNRTWQVRAVAYQYGGIGGGVITPGADWETLYPVDGVLTFTAESGAVVDIKTPEGVPYRVRIPTSNAGLWDVIEAGVAYQPDVAQDNLNLAVANAAPGFIAAELGLQTADAISADLAEREITFTDSGDGEGYFSVGGVAVSGTLVPPAATWSGVSGKPAVMGVGDTQSEAREAIDAAAPADVPLISGSRAQADGSGLGLGPNFIAGGEDNAVASDLGSATIGGGGYAGRENVIGGDGSATVNTSTPNATQTGTGANLSIIPGGYDNVAGGLASVVVGYHNYTALETTHGTISGGSIQKIIGSNNDYSTIGGGSANTASADGCTISGGQNNTASGPGAVIGGGNTNVSSNSATTVAGGLENTASGSAATVVGGRQNTASGETSTAIGRDVLADQIGELAHSAGKFAAQGDAQVRRFVGRNTGTSATVVSLFLNGSSTRPRIPEDSTWFVTVKIAARRTDADGESAAYRLEACMDRNSGDTAALVGSVAKTVVGEDTAAWDVAMAVNSSGTVNITCTGEAAKTIQWVALVEAVQVTG